MGSLNNVQIGSIILNMVEDVPTTISGTTLWNMVDQERYFAEQFTGDTIGTSIADKYQPAIISLTSASIIKLMEMQGLGTKSVKIGDISITKGISESTSKNLREDGIQKLENLGQSILSYKALG